MLGLLPSGVFGYAYLRSNPFLGFSFIGCFIIQSSCWLRREHGTGFAGELCVSALLPIFAVASALFEEQQGHFMLLTWDARLYHLDGLLGCEPAWICGRILRSSVVLLWIASFVYYSAPLAVALACAARRDRQDRLRLWKVLGLASVLGVACYQLVPACGPAHAFPGQFPVRLPQTGLGLMAVDVTHPRNCMPSLHYTWTLLCLWYGKKYSMGWAVPLLWFYFSMTVFATLATGEHNDADLAAAVPFAWFCRGTIER
jgi:hypothetical protein